MNPWHSERRAWSIGIDLGQANDPSAVCGIERVQSYVREHAQDKPKLYQTRYNVRHLERLPLGLPYPQQAAHFLAMLARPELAGADVYVDGTGVGRAVCDLLRDTGLKFTAVHITSGRNVTGGAGVAGVPKLELISRLQAALHAGELKIAKTLPEAGAFVRELAAFRVQQTDSGALTFNAKQGAHDDLVLAAALALWGAARTPKDLDLSFMLWPRAQGRR
jgi:hypothetical protein